MAGDTITSEHRERLRALLLALIDQTGARVLVEPQERSTGYWFGGGNLCKAADGTLLLVGRYRNFGDSRTGVAAGTRGLELSVFASTDEGRCFKKVRSWSKADLSRVGGPVLSIEGAALHPRAGGSYELFVSLEKDEPYPEEVAAFQKPGTGVWSIDRFHGEGVDSLDAQTMAPVLAETPEPGYLHVKDPKFFDMPDGDTVLFFADHPFLWSSMNTGYALRRAGDTHFTVQNWEMVPRGPAWDVAGTRLTNRMPIPRMGAFADMPPMSVYFYDGLECYRSLEENPRGVQRPRGYSCEELGGAFCGFDAEFPAMRRLSGLLPLFVSPHGTGCSRYVDTLVDEEGILAVWQQSQKDLSQPLVGHSLSMDKVARLLA